MDKKNNKSELYDLLCLNSKDEVRNYVLKNGKGPKVIRPVIYLEKSKEGLGDE